MPERVLHVRRTAQDPDTLPPIEKWVNHESRPPSPFRCQSVVAPDDGAPMGTSRAATLGRRVRSIGPATMTVRDDPRPSPGTTPPPPPLPSRYVGASVMVPSTASAPREPNMWPGRCAAKRKVNGWWVYCERPDGHRGCHWHYDPPIPGIASGVFTNWENDLNDRPDVVNA
jgi:hypothetical protein